MAGRRRTPYALTTTQRGLGSAHQKRVAYLKDRHLPGTPCRRCGYPMWDTATLDGGHADGHERARGGGALPDALEHRHCNRSAGATYGHTLRAAKRQVAAPLPTSRRW